MDCYSKCRDKMPARHILCLMFFLGFMVTFLNRVNINLAIVAMANTTQAGASDLLAGTVSQECSHLSDVELRNTSVTAVELDSIAEFDWNEFQQSIILSSFFWGYVLFQVPGGRIAELCGTKTVFGYSIFINGILSLAVPLGARLHWTLLLAVRAMQGLAQGVVFPCLNTAVAKWVPLEERARFISFSIQGCSLGQVVALPLCGWILTHYGWPAVFYVSGGLAITWFVIWHMLMYDSPEEHPRISDKEKRFLESNLPKRDLNQKPPPVPWISVFTSIQFWVGVVANIGNDWGFHTFCNFGPKYMKSALGFDLEQSSWLSSLPFLSQYFFAIGYGTFCDSLLKRNVNLLTVRKMSVVISHIVPCIGMFTLSMIGCDIALSLILLTLSVSAVGAISCGFFQNPLDIAPNYAGSLTGMVNAIGATTAVVSTPLAGAILQSTGSPAGWRYIFGITAAMFLATSLPYLFLATAKTEPWNDLRNIRTKKKFFSLREVATTDCEPEENDILTESSRGHY